MGDVLITYLEITDVARIRPARPPRMELRIARATPPDGALSRRFYIAVGGPWSWTDRLGENDAWWQAHAESVETWVLGEDAGYYELRRNDRDVKIEYFGLMPAFHGLGLGGRLLEHALRRGFELGDRVWLHTCTLDGPHALANYLARGLVVYGEER